MRKIPKRGPNRYKHAYNVGYKAGILKGQNSAGPKAPQMDLSKPITVTVDIVPSEKLVKLLELLKEPS